MPAKSTSGANSPIRHFPSDRIRDMIVNTGPKPNSAKVAALTEYRDIRP